MPIFAAVDCVTNSGSINNNYINANELYVTCYNVLLNAQTSGHVTRIAYGTGSAVSGALGTGVDYWDTGNASGGNSFSVWRFNSSSYRPYEFYLYLGYAANSTGLGTEPSQSIQRNTTSILYSPLIFQIATSFNPNTGATTNPWNGTTNNNGTDTFNTLTSTMWRSASAGNILHVYPMGNMSDSTFTGSRNLVGVLASGLSATNAMRFNFYVATGTQGDGILMVYKANAPSDTVWEWNFATTYSPRVEISSSVKVPLVYCSNDESSSDFSTTISTVSWLTGSSGIALPDNQLGNPFFTDVEWWAKPGNVPANSFLGTQPAQELSYPQLCINGNTGIGFLGTVDSPLMKIVGGLVTDSLVNSQNNVIFGASTGGASLKLMTPWSSSVGAGPGTLNYRTGSTF